MRTQDGDGPWEEATAADPLKVLEGMIEAYRAPHLPGLPRFCGGAVGYAGYDTVRYVERLPNAPPDDRRMPDLSFAFYDRMVIFDHVNKTIAAVAHWIGLSSSGDLPKEYAEVCRRVDRLVDKLQTGSSDLALSDIDPLTANPSALSARVSSNFTQPQYEAAVKKAVEYINAGDIFQVVLSQRFQTQTTAHPFDIYRTLRVVNPSPFMFYVRSGSATLVGASPEIMCRVENGEITIRPLAGTRRAAVPPTKTSSSPTNCSPIQRNAPNTSCSSTWPATTSAASPNSAASASATCSPSSATATSCTSPAT